MAQERLSMRKIREILRLRWVMGTSFREIAASTATCATSVRDCLVRAEAAGLGWPLPDDLDDGQLEARLYPGGASARDVPEPDWDQIHRELKRKYVTRELLWMEYKQAHPDGFQYSQFCSHYNTWRNVQGLVFRREHKAGERAFVDYAGGTIIINDLMTGEKRKANVFVMVLGASNYAYAEATWTQGQCDWVSAHVRGFEFFGGVPTILTPDNLKAGVTRACLYDPDLNPTYYEMARYYGCAVIPARPRKPRDKAKVEAGVGIVGRWIIAALRNRTFHSLASLNEAIAELLTRLNDRPFKKIKGSRRELFEQIERQALQPLPEHRYQYVDVKLARVNIDYHVEIQDHYYSVPYNLVREEVEVRFNDVTVEILHKGQRVASHQRSFKRGGFSTVHEHRPPAHRAHVEWTPERIVRWAAEAGESAASLAKAIIDSKDHPEQGYRAVLGLIRLGDKYGKPRLNAACNRALSIGSPTYRSVKSILKVGFDREPATAEKRSNHSVAHENIRGPEYYKH